MPGFTGKKIVEDYPTRSDAIAAVIQQTARCLDSLPKIHPEIDAINKQQLINEQQQTIEVINISSAWD